MLLSPNSGQSYFYSRHPQGSSTPLLCRDAQNQQRVGRKKEKNKSKTKSVATSQLDEDPLQSRDSPRRQLCAFAVSYTDPWANPPCGHPSRTAAPPELRESLPQPGWRRAERHSLPPHLTWLLPGPREAPGHTVILPY